MSSVSPMAPVAPVQREHLFTQLACPLPFRLPRSLYHEARVLLMAQRLLAIAESALQLVSFGLGVRKGSF